MMSTENIVENSSETQAAKTQATKSIFGKAKDNQPKDKQDEILRVLKLQLFHRRVQTVLFLGALIAIIGIYPKVNAEIAVINTLLSNVESKVDKFDMDNVNKVVNTAQTTLESTATVIDEMDDVVAKSNDILESIKVTSDALADVSEKLNKIGSIFGK